MAHCYWDNSNISKSFAFIQRFFSYNMLAFHPTRHPDLSHILRNYLAVLDFQIKHLIHDAMAHLKEHKGANNTITLTYEWIHWLLEKFYWQFPFFNFYWQESETCSKKTVASKTFERYLLKKFEKIKKYRESDGKAPFIVQFYFFYLAFSYLVLRP